MLFLGRLLYLEFTISDINGFQTNIERLKSSSNIFEVSDLLNNSCATTSLAKCLFF